MSEMRSAIEALATKADGRGPSVECVSEVDRLSPSWFDCDYSTGPGAVRSWMPESVDLAEIASWAEEHGLRARIEWNGHSYSDSAHYIDFYWVAA